MNRKIVYMFSGQGSQYFQMGKELYENHAQFRYWMNHCDEMVSPLIQASLVDVLYCGQSKTEPFDHLLYTNPALLCIEYCLVNVLGEMGVKPDYLIGYSLGELTACVVSGAISLEDGIQLVIATAKLVEEKTQTADMLAIMASTKIMTEFSELFRNCWLTGKNFQENFVVCGLSDAVQHLKAGLNKEGIISQILPVKYGFHTGLIDPIEEGYKQFVRKINLLPFKIPIISSLKSEIITELNEDYLWEVIRYPVNFEKTIHNTLKMGDFAFVDAGPSGILATFVKYILPPNSGSTPLQTINQFGKDLNSIEKLRRALFVDAC